MFSQLGLRPRFLSGDWAPGGWLQPGFRATCSYLGTSAKLVNIQLLLLQPLSCQQEPLSSLHRLSAKGSSRGRAQTLPECVEAPHALHAPLSQIGARLLSLSSRSACPPEPASQGEEAGAESFLSSSPSRSLTPSLVLSTLFHLSNPPFHPSTSFLILLPYTKP